MSRDECEREHICKASVLAVFVLAENGPVMRGQQPSLSGVAAKSCKARADACRSFCRLGSGAEMAGESGGSELRRAATFLHLPEGAARADCFCLSEWQQGFSYEAKFWAKIVSGAEVARWHGQTQR